MENIGYDVSTAESRAEIHADHVWVRELRQGTGKFRKTAMAMLTVAVLGGVGQWIARFVWASIKTVLELHKAGS